MYTIGQLIEILPIFLIIKISLSCCEKALLCFSCAHQVTPPYLISPFLLSKKKKNGNSMI